MLHSALVVVAVPAGTSAILTKTSIKLFHDSIPRVVALGVKYINQFIDEWGDGVIFNFSLIVFSYSHPSHGVSWHQKKTTLDSYFSPLLSFPLSKKVCV